MNIYVINLDKDTEKMASVDKQLIQQGLHYERIRAVYGRDLAKNEVVRAVNLFKWWCAVGGRPALAEIGCGLSHQSIYAKMLSEKIPIACVLEDDVALAQDFAERINYVAHTIDPNRSQVVLLSDHVVADRKDGSFVRGEREEQELVRIYGDYCTEGYCLTVRAAEALLALNKPMVVPIDWWGRFAKCRGGIELFHAKPTVCSQMQTTFGSSTSIGRRTVSEMGLSEKVLHYGKRLIGKTIDEILMRV